MRKNSFRRGRCGAYSGPAMPNRTFIVACLLAVLAACERPQQPLAGAAARDVPREPVEHKTISAVPEHFDRVRVEQLEKDEERLRRRGGRH
jgi:hypothetical protein